MNIYAVNASPRKKWNTATVLRHALEGAASIAPDAHAELLHLYDYRYKGRSEERRVGKECAELC